MTLKTAGVLATIWAVFVGLAGSAEPSKARSDAAKIVGCLAGQDWFAEDLHEIGLALGQTAVVRFRVGAIEGQSPNRQFTTNLLLLGPSRTKGWLFFATMARGGRVTLLRNAYRLNLSDGRWSAGEGNGGVATYAAIASYVGKMAKQQSTRERLQPARDNCRVGE